MQKFVSSIRAASFKDNLVLLLCILVPVCLQIQITLFKTEDYLGLRINLTDILAPFAGIAIFASLLLKKSLWPQWSISDIYYWLCGLSLVLITATIHTYFLWGEFSHWAIFNKIAGWFIILAIFAMGAWIATNAKKEHIEILFKILVEFFLLVLIYQIVVSTLQNYEFFRYFIIHYKYVDFQIAGFMANRNAYAFLAITVSIFATILSLQKTGSINSRTIWALYIFLPAFFYFNASRAGILAFALVFPFIFLIYKTQAKKCFQLILTFIIFVIVFGIGLYDRKGNIPLFSNLPTEVFEQVKHEKDLDKINQSIVYHGDKMRLTILQDTFELIKEKPIFGSGLGSIMIDQKQKHGELINLMDSTPLWLWAEIGIVGLLAFFAFGLKIIHALWKKLKGDDDFEKSIRLSTLFLILGFSTMCIFHEILYTRHLWFFLGFALALPSKMHRHE